MLESSDRSLTINQNDWSLHRKGARDLQRHQEKVQEVIKKGLPDLISDGGLIGSDGKNIIKVPIRSLELPKFRYGDNNRDHVGQGSGNSKVGDTVGNSGLNAQPGAGDQAGDMPGIDFYEAEVSVDDLKELLFEGLDLPYLEPKGGVVSTDISYKFTEIRKTGIMGNLDKRRTMKESLRRSALTGNDQKITQDDLRYRTWQEEKKEDTRALIIAMRDVSGSMDLTKTFQARTFFFWMEQLLMERYAGKVETLFITHHTKAEVRDRQAFYSLSTSGGTKVSSAYELAIEQIDKNYPPSEWNIYPFHFSDGDTQMGKSGSDRWGALELSKQLLERSNMLGYVETRAGSGQLTTSNLMSVYSEIKDDRFRTARIFDANDLFKAFRKMFSA